MKNPVLGTIALLIAAVIIYIIASGSSELSKKEKVVCYVWILILIIMSTRMI